MLHTPTLRPANLKDLNPLIQIIDGSAYVHRHLDWRPTLDWLGSQPFWLMENRGRIIAALAIPVEPVEPLWIRLFVVAHSMDPAEAFQSLLAAALPAAQRSETPATIAALALQDWMRLTLEQCGIPRRQDVIVLRWNPREAAHPVLPDGVQIRWMTVWDLPEVAAIDNQAFEDIWRCSFRSVEMSYASADYATVLTLDGKIAAFQTSGQTRQGAHLARLAVAPSQQGRHFGRLLVEDLLAEFTSRGLDHITVNTQSDNLISQTLYRSLGFEFTGERFPVHTKQVA